MTKSKKITDEQLLQELENGVKTEKEIAHSNGYGYPSSALNDRIHELGFTSNQKITVKDNNAGQFYLGSETLEKAADQKNIDLENKGKVFFQVEKVSDGRVVLEVTTDSFRKVEE